MRVLIFGDGAWAADSTLALNSTGHELIGVVVRRKPSDSTLETVARRLKIPVFQPLNVNAPDIVEMVSSLAPDLGVSISYNQILRRPVLDSARLGFVNFHAGMLPNYRGRNVINWAIINGEKEIGLTAHYIDEGIDTGGILLQRTIPILWTDTYGDVLERVVGNFPEFVNSALKLVADGKISSHPQSHLTGTYFAGRELGDEWLDWSDTSMNLYNKARAITRPGPGARTLLGDKEVVIWSAKYELGWPKYLATPGQVVGRTREGVIVKTGDSTLLVQEVQIEGNICETPVWPIGTRLGANVLSIIRSLQSRIWELEVQLSGRLTTHVGSSR